MPVVCGKCGAGTRFLSVASVLHRRSVRMAAAACGSDNGLERTCKE